MQHNQGPSPHRETSEQWPACTLRTPSARWHAQTDGQQDALELALMGKIADTGEVSPVGIGGRIAPHGPFLHAVPACAAVS